MGLLDDRVAIVTGAGPGLGRATALALAREGAAVVLAARDARRLDELRAEIEAAGGRALGVPTDVTDADQCDRLVEAASGGLGGLDVVVNSAFRPDLYGPFAQVDLDRWRGIFEVNLFGALRVTQAAVPALEASDHAAVVNVGSMSARRIRGGEGGYATSKAALHAATQALAQELGPAGIRVNAAVPGWIKGPSVDRYLEWESQRRGVDRAAIEEEIESRIPLGFIPTSEDVAETIVFLASDMSRPVTGQSLDVNGGEYFG